MFKDLQLPKAQFFLLLLIVFVFYYWTVSEGKWTINFKPIEGTYTNIDKYKSDYFYRVRWPNDYYNLLADAFLAGQLHLLVKPRPELLAAPDPYDVSTYEPYRLQDASLYKGKYYIYFGPVPAVLFYIPFRLITKYNLPDTLSTLFFVYGGFLWIVALLVLLCREYFQKVPEWMLFFAILVVAFANIGPFILRRVEFYEVAISSGFFFLTGAIYFFCRFLSQRNLRTVFLGSLFLGLSIGCRMHFLFSGLVILTILILRFLYIRNESDGSPFRRHQYFLALMFPVIVCLLIYALYNYLRFENPFELGTKYQLTGADLKKLKFIHINFLLPWLSFYLFHPPLINASFPFAYLTVPPVPKNLIPPGPFFIEQIAGVFPCIPFVLIAFFPLLVFLLNRDFVLETTNEKIRLFPVIEFLIILISGLINLIIISLLWGATVRYIMDFATSFILSSIIVWFYFENTTGLKYYLKSLLRMLAILLGTISIIFGMAFSISGYYDILKNRNPKEFNKLKSFFKPVSDVIFFMVPTPESVWERLPAAPFRISVVASSTHSEGLKASNALDEDLNSAWAAFGSNPCVLTFKPENPAITKSIWLLSRKTSLYEGWKKMKVKLYLNEELQLEKTFFFSNAHKERVQHAEFPPIPTDKIELWFSEPVTINLEGKYIGPEALSPGYSEILFDWIGSINSI